MATKRLDKEQMQIYKKEGHTAKEVAEKFNCSLAYARKICSGIAPQSYTKNYTKSVKDINEFIKERLPGCEYAGNYTGADGRVNLRCTKCGTVFNRSMISVRKKHCACPTCKLFNHLEIKGRDERTKREKQIQREEKEKERKQREKKQAKERAAKIEQRLHNCPVCGEPTSRPKYCSNKCRKKAENKRHDINRQRRIKEGLVDKDITVMGLFKRDAGVCYICGEVCDFEDHIQQDGVFIAGECYPSIDHVIPLSKGGRHSWDNVKLAHKGCNTKIYNNIQRFAPPTLQNCNDTP